LATRHYRNTALRDFLILQNFKSMTPVIISSVALINNAGYTITHMQRVKRFFKKTGVTLLGFVLLVAGAAMLVLPGPGIVVIILGLVVLSWEYEWAKHRLDRARTAQKSAVEKLRQKKDRQKNT